MAAAFAFGLTSCSKDPEPEPPKPSASATASPSPSPSPSPSEAGPTLGPEDEAPEDTAETELKKAREMFPNIDEEGEQKDNVQLALFNATRYVDSIYDNGYLANGAWDKDGADSQRLYELHGHNWTDDYRGKIDSIISDYKDGETQEIKDDAAKTLLTHFFYLNDVGSLSASADCETPDESAPSCLTERIEIKDMQYTIFDDGNIAVDGKFTINVKTKKDGVEGIVPIDYTVWLEMTKNPYPDVENFRYTWIVQDAGGGWKSGGWSAKEK